MENEEYKTTPVDATEPPIWRIALISGLVGAAAIAIVSMAVYMSAGDDIMKARDNKAGTFVPYLILLASVIWGIVWIKRKFSDPVFSFGSGFRAGLRTTLILIAGVGVFTYINTYRFFSNPENVEKVRAIAIEQMEKRNPNMTDEQMQTALKWMEFFTSPLTASLGAMIWYFIIGLIFSLVVGIFTQTRE